MNVQNRLAELEELYSGADWQAIFQDGGMDAVEEYAETVPPVTVYKRTGTSPNGQHHGKQSRRTT